MHPKVLTSTLAALLLCLGSLQAATIVVPDDHATIQAALDAAAGGDVILVLPGTYFENIDFVGKAVTVTSEQGPVETTIDGGRIGSVAVFESGEGPDAVLEGFTITNGLAGNGGGIYCGSGAAPTITGNIISANEATGLYGGGIYCYRADAAVTGNVITGNLSGERGGGICTYQAAPRITGNELTLNSALYSGGAIACFQSTAVITGNTVSGNTAPNAAGIECYDSALTVTHNDISGNTGEGSVGIGVINSPATIVTDNRISNNIATYYSGGISCVESPALIARNIIVDNSGGSGVGGGITCSFNSGALITDNVIVGNTAGWLGGGIACNASDPAIVNNTVIDNSAAYCGGGIYATESSDLAIANTILRGNQAPDGAAMFAEAGSTLTISHSNVADGQAAVSVDATSSLFWGAGMIDADPIFVEPAAGDLHLTWSSPCRGAGDPSTTDPDGTDFEGDPRLVGGFVDMGADQFHEHLYAVGAVSPGAAFHIRVAGTPGEEVLLILGKGTRIPPKPTAYGNLHLVLPAVRTVDLGDLSVDGILDFAVNTPSGWCPGAEKPLQALVGPLGGPASMLTNLMILEVE